MGFEEEKSMNQEPHTYMAISTDDHFVTYVHWHKELNTYHASVYESDAIFSDNPDEFLFWRTAE